MEFYRYYLRVQMDEMGFPDPVVELFIFKLDKETPCGYWIKGYGERKWVSKDSTKRFAYPTKEEAKYSLKRRTQRRITILRSQLHQCEAAIKMDILQNTP